MPRLSEDPTALRRRLFFGGAVALAVLSCGREPTAPGGAAARVPSQAIAFATEFPAAFPQFQAAGASGVAFTRVRIVLNNPDGTVALDTVVKFPSDATEFRLTLSVPLPASAPASGVPLALRLKYVNAAGDTVFTGGPVTVNAVPKSADGSPPPASQVTIPITYTGPGANATSVRISPSTLTVNTGRSYTFTAQAFDASGNGIPNTPIVFSSQNQVLASVNAATGAGVAGAARGSVSIVAQLLTGPTDAATLTIVSPPSALALVSGSGQAGTTGAALAQPVVVKVTAADGLPAAGVSVAFAAANGGAVGAASVPTGADGTAQTTWKLGPAAGAQTLTASVSGLTGSPVTFMANAAPLTPVRLLVATGPPAASPATSAFGLVVVAVDAQGAATSAFIGPVSVALGAGAPTTAVLSGTTTVNALDGVATFTDLHVNVIGTYTLVVTTPNLTGATTGSFQIIAGAARRLVFGNYPIIGATAGATFDPVTVYVRDDLGNPVTSFTGPATVTANGASAVAAALGAGAAGHTANISSADALSGTTTVNAVGGVATFPALTLTLAGSYTLTAASAGLVSVTGPAFAITPGPAANLSLFSGGGQSGPGGVPFANPIVVKAADAFGNGVAGVTVSFSPVGSGTASPASSVTTSDGTARTVWTATGAAGPQTLNASASGLLPNPLVVTATTTTAGGPVFTWTGVSSLSPTNWGNAANWSTGTVPTSTDDVVIPTSAATNPVLSTSARVHNLTIETGRSIDLICNGLYVYGNVVAPLGAPATVDGECHSSIVLYGDAASPYNTIVGNFDNVGVFGKYRISGQLIANRQIYIENGNVTVNGGRLDVGGVGGTGAGSFYTYDTGTLTMTNTADQVFVGTGGAWFQGGSTTGLLTAGTITLVSSGTTSSGLHAIQSYAAPDAFAPSGTHKVVFVDASGTHPPSVGFYDPMQSFLNDADITAGTGILLGTAVHVNGKLSRAGTGAVAIATTGSTQTLTVKGLGFSSTGATTMNNVSLVLTGSNGVVFDNVTWTGFPAAFTGNVFDVNRSGAALTFNGHDFSAVTLSGGHWLRNLGTANVHMATPTPSSVTTEVLQVGTGTITWP